MTSPVPRAPIIAAFLLALTSSVPTARAFNGHHQNVEVIPTVYAPTVLTAPSTSYVTTSYYVPTSYSSVLYPTVYSSSILTPTYYVEPTAYVVPTTYRSRWRRSASRPIYTTSQNYYYDLTPTSYAWTTYWPTTTTLDVPVVVSPTSLVATDDCYVQPASNTTTAPPAPPAGSSRQSNPATSGGVNAVPPATLQSRPTNGGSNESAPMEPGGQAPTSPPVGTTPGVEPGFEFPAQPAPEKGATPLDGQSIPLPAPGTETGVAPGSETRSAYRPAPTDMAPRPTLPTLGSLRGSVIATKTRQPEAGVRVVFTDARQRFGDRQTTSDTAGLFEVTLPEGDWRVSVENADGTLTPYGNLTVASGRFYDERGRIVSSLRLHH